MQIEWATINQVPTKVLTWGKTLQEAKDHIGENLNYIVCICGNPGIPDAYIEFLDEIHRRTNNVVWILSHAGHSVNNVTDMPLYEENKELYELEGQIKHKASINECCAIKFKEKFYCR
ncbi:lipase [Holotrichia oblita]|uniref:Lipase n=1 Tax=Holotrichia oblita TaxID=644536 RepID=A0ACB9SV48_HOLOL|nr:lipase [Holotrichia oblita]